MTRYLFILFFIFNYLSLNSQDLTKHQWENRLLLVFSNASHADQLQMQLKAFETAKAEYLDRKLLVYIISENETQCLNTKQAWPKDKSLDNYRRTDKAFEVVLVGLDGGVKANKNQFFDNPSLFALIDGMPMRRYELNKRAHE